ncbi:MAG: hypothetical protein ACRDHY_19205 [Anaerolineales bacterium]
MAANPTGVGEPLIMVVAGSFDSAELASAAGARMSFGEFQGFYVDEAKHYEVIGFYRRQNPLFIVDQGRRLRQEAVLEAVSGSLPRLEPGTWLLLTAFRTKRGAEEFIDLAASRDIGELDVVQVIKRGGTYVGLGQEPHPDGTGALQGPMANPLAFQR